MRPGDIFREEAKTSIKAAVASIESRSSAEVVVTARRASGHYQNADYLAGLVVLFVVLAVFLYHPAEFDFTYLPLELLGAFVFGAVLSASVPPVRRLFLSRKRMASEVERSARSAFFELGIGKTRGRTGVLVFVSAFERKAIVVSDVGVPSSEALLRAKERVGGVARSGNLAAFVSALGDVGKELASLLPRADDDVNELPDDMHEAAR